MSFFFINQIFYSNLKILLFSTYVPIKYQTQIDYTIPIPKRIRRLYQRLAKKQRGSQNSLKLRQLLHKAFVKWVNRKLDVTNQLTSRLTTQYQYICFQNDPISH
ncbi:MAG: hypothetical protein ACFFC7_08690 [Candidatus Hermodarchaeota archaeon]